MFDKVTDHIERVPPLILKRLLSGVIWEGTPDSDVIALTFDDGPDPEITPRVLDALESNGARGTFFLVGEKAAAHPGIVRDIVARGHAIGNHTMTHRRLFFAGSGVTAAEIDGCGWVLADITGEAPTLFRPPHGVFDVTALRTVRDRGLSLVLWTALAGDYRDRSAAGTVAAVEPFVRPGAIVVFHDTSDGGGADLPVIIDAVARLAGERGLVPGGLHELTIAGDMALAEEPDD